MARASAPTPSPAARGHLDADADEVEQPLLRQPVQQRMGADQEPGRRASSGRRRMREPRIPDAFDKSKKHVPTMLTTDLSLRVRPGLREDLAALPRASGPVRGRVCPRVVQAHAPRHGPDPALPRPARAEGDADLAGPDPDGESSADRRAGHRCPEGEDPGVRPVGVRSWSRPRGRRRRRSAAPTSAVAPTARAFASRRRRTGRSTSRLSSRPSWRSSKRSRRTSARRFRSPT